MKEKNSGKLGLVITDGVGYRNFILSNFLAEAVKNFEEVIIYSGLPEKVYSHNSYNNLKITELPVYVEPFQTWFWRKFKEVAHLQLHKDYFGINDNLKANKSNSESNRGKAIRLIYRITNLFHSEKFIRILEKRQQRSLRNHKVTKECLGILKNNEPGLLFFTHQRPPYVVPLVAAAQNLGIKTSSFIFSWDNLASKGRMAAGFNFYLVWSDLMKEELIHFYPATKADDVEVVGTPQFEPYIMPEYESTKNDFFKKFELDPTKKTICYSCGDVSTSQNDALYIEAIASAIQADKVSEEVNFIVRTSPAEEPERFLYLKEKYPFISWNFPDWFVAREEHPEPWSQRIPRVQDIKDLRALLEYTDLNLNMCSTMSLDFMLFNKPVINPVFGNEENGLYNDQRFLKFGHYEKVVQSGAVQISKNKAELIEAINTYLMDPHLNKANRMKLLDLQIGKSLEGTSMRIVKKLKKIIEV
ncbi:hypothetical protein [Christiangramia sediminis]|uniref:UDP-glycosyltransferase n=1 Tax=Christiangramia sediminis TaxID=2881336 RepID=A0A9X1LJC7_9FLAO|nr:hypothetical protein [Christiangramia sediminis]MCB7481319.1 hypothetical protein [Christiangramia sediminis]